jgi:hypothetical protein
MSEKTIPLWHRRILKTIVNVWTVVTMVLFVLDFFSGNTFDTAATSIGIIYIALLGIYVGDKEYSRWKSKFVSKFLGELFIVFWTVIMVAMVIISALGQGHYIVPSEFALVYTAVIGVFAVSQHSKALKEN